MFTAMQAYYVSRSQLSQRKCAMIDII